MSPTDSPEALTAVYEERMLTWVTSLDFGLRGGAVDDHHGRELAVELTIEAFSYAHAEV